MQARGLLLAAVTLKQWGLKRLAHEIKLVLSELVTNAVHATSIRDHEPSWGQLDQLATVHVRLTLLESRIVIEVWTVTPPSPKPSAADVDAETAVAWRDRGNPVYSLGLVPRTRGRQGGGRN